MKYIQPENERRVLDALGSLIANHADWLDGRTFQRLTRQAAEAYFPEEDLDIFVTPVEFAKVVEDALEYAIQDIKEKSTDKTPLSVEATVPTSAQ